MTFGSSRRVSGRRERSARGLVGSTTVRKPKNHPKGEPERARTTSAAVVSKILHLRQTYHFGRGKIADYLKRFHQLTVRARPCTAASAAT
jgi:hypothetical protein